MRRVTVKPKSSKAKNRLCTDCGELEDPVSVLREIADEVEAL